MPGRPAIFSTLALGAVSLLAGCATARMHSADELAAVERRCGLSAGELIQDVELPRVLIFHAASPSRAQLGCVRRWSRRHGLHLAYIDAVAFEE